MNSREKVLSSAVGGLVLLVIAYFVWSSASDTINIRRGRLRQVTQEKERQERTIELASRATAGLAKLNLRSLPKNREHANSVYSEWLLEVVDRVGFREPSVKATDRRYRKGYFDRLRFQIEGEATLEQFTEFLAEFYAANDLHRIENLTLKPIRDSRHLDINLAIEAISLPNSERTRVGDTRSNEVTPEMIVAAREAILNRSVFFPLNIAPQLEDIAEQQLVRGRRWRLEAKATDPDPWDEVRFELKNDTPEGLQLTPASDRAVLAWTPREVGEYTIQLAVRDTGSPSRETVREITLKVIEPPTRTEQPGIEDRPRVAGFDHATQTFLAATVGNGATRKAWFDVRTEGKLLQRAIGESLNVGSVEGKVVEIGRRHVQLETKSGKLRIAIGESITEARPEVARK